MKKNFSLILIAVFAILFASSAFSQELSKEESKVWKDKLKAFYGQYKKDLAGFKKFIEDKDAAEAQIPKLEAEVNRLNDKQRQQADEIDDLRATNSFMEQQLKDLQAGADNSGGTPGPNGIPNTGVAFTVQIGAYTKISGVTGGNSGNFVAEGDGAVTKYMIGIFDNYDEAKEMRDSLRQMGAKDAFVVAYKDGNRVPVTEVANSAG